MTRECMYLPYFLIKYVFIILDTIVKDQCHKRQKQQIRKWLFCFPKVILSKFRLTVPIMHME